MNDLIENQKKLERQQAFLVETLIRVLEDNVQDKEATLSRLKVISRSLWS